MASKIFKTIVTVQQKPRPNQQTIWNWKKFCQQIQGGLFQCKTWILVVNIGTSVLRIKLKSASQVKGGALSPPPPPVCALGLSFWFQNIQIYTKRTENIVFFMPNIRLYQVSPQNCRFLKEKTTIVGLSVFLSFYDSLVVCCLYFHDSVAD